MRIREKMIEEHTDISQRFLLAHLYLSSPGRGILYGKMIAIPTASVFYEVWYKAVIWLALGDIAANCE